MHGGRPNPVWLPVLGFVCAAACILSGCTRGLPPRNGIRNFGKVDDKVYRGSQPNEAGIQNLKALGVKSIINLRNPGKEWATEESEARTGGILFTNIPLGGFGRPTDEEIAKILSLIETMPAPVFVHCEYGCDRTGTVIAAYRIRHDQWTAEAALKEADRYGMSDLERGMKEFIRDFAKATTNSTKSAR